MLCYPTTSTPNVGKQGYVLGPWVYYLGVYGYADAVFNASCPLVKCRSYGGRDPLKISNWSN